MDCSPPSCSLSFSVPEWDQPLTEQELHAIEAIEASFQSTVAGSSLAGKRPCAAGAVEVAEDTPKPGRRLPTSFLFCPPPRSFLSPCQSNMKLRLPALKFGGRIIYSRSAMEVDRAVEELLKNAEEVRKETGQATLGFDIEWKPTFKRGGLPGKAAVMQLCLGTRNCDVMHIIHSGIPQSLKTLLEDSTLLKVGVGIANDAVKIFRDYNVSIQAVEELSSLANKKLPGGGIQRWSLGSLTEMLISKELQKPNKIRLGNWEADLLSKEQLLYAATDAFASWYLYEVLKRLPDAQVVADEEGSEEVVAVSHNDPF